MSGDDRFTPRLGRPGNAGGRHQGRFLQHMAKEVARLRKGVKPTRQKSAGRGRGAVAGRMAQIRPQRFAAHRMRRWRGAADGDHDITGGDLAAAHTRGGRRRGDPATATCATA